MVPLFLETPTWVSSGFLEDKRPPGPNPHVFCLAYFLACVFFATLDSLLCGAVLSLFELDCSAVRLVGQKFPSCIHGSR